MVPTLFETIRRQQACALSQWLSHILGYLYHRNLKDRTHPAHYIPCMLCRSYLRVSPGAPVLGDPVAEQFIIWVGIIYQ